MQNHQYPRLSKEDINELPLIAFEGNVILIEDPKEASKAVTKLSQEPILGFDTETRPTFEKGYSNRVALVQLSTETTCYLFRLNHIHMPAELRALLQNPNVLKVGVGLENDVLGLQDWDVDVLKNTLDLGEHARSIHLPASGVRPLVALFLEGRISKTARVSNWEKPELTSSQIRYAATDAWVCYQLYHQFLEHGLLPHHI